MGDIFVSSIPFACMEQGISRYSLVTPAFNEETNIRRLVESVNSQTEKPLEWIIVNNGSTDDTVKILKRIISLHEISYIKIVNCARNLDLASHENISNSTIVGFNEAMASLDDSVKYIGNLDADVVLPKFFFEMLCDALDVNETYGAVSGQSYTCPGYSLPTFCNKALVNCQKDIIARDSLRNIRLYRIESLESVGGMPYVRYSQDSAILYLLRSAGWGTKMCKSVPFILVRETTSMRQTEENAMKAGRIAYYYQSSFFHLTMQILYEVLIWKSLMPLKSFSGYFKSAEAHDEIAPAEILEARAREKTILNLVKSLI